MNFARARTTRAFNVPLPNLLLGLAVIMAKYVFLFWSFMALMLSVRGIKIIMFNPEGCNLWLVGGVCIALSSSLMVLSFYSASDVIAVANIPSWETRLAFEWIVFVGLGLHYVLEWGISPGNLFFTEPTGRAGFWLDPWLLIGALTVVAIPIYVEEKRKRKRQEGQGERLP